MQMTRINLWYKKLAIILMQAMLRLILPWLWCICQLCILVPSFSFIFCFYLLDSQIIENMSPWEFYFVLCQIFLLLLESQSSNFQIFDSLLLGLNFSILFLSYYVFVFGSRYFRYVSPFSYRSSAKSMSFEFLFVVIKTVVYNDVVLNVIIMLLWLLVYSWCSCFQGFFHRYYLLSLSLMLLSSFSYVVLFLNISVGLLEFVFKIFEVFVGCVVLLIVVVFSVYYRFYG